MTKNWIVTKVNKKFFLRVGSKIFKCQIGKAGHKIHTKKKEGDNRPLGLSPTISFGGGAYTENGTWAGFIGHKGSYNKDNIRYLGFLGYVSPNLTFYGPGLGGITDKKYEFNMQGFVTLQELQFRIKKEIPLFVGLNYSYFSNKITFVLLLSLILKYHQPHKILRRIFPNENQYFFIQYYNGYGEGLLDYNKFHSRLRVGFVIKPQNFSNY